MSKKKNKKRHPNIANRPLKSSVPKKGATPTLSLCMITKNEEKNIETALAWAKELTFEQIVVDTGSTDRTVEIAESMGAKVFHFEWIDDFAAAKNYAIEQASGSWIVFFDADEYFLKPDAERLALRISQIDSSGAYPDCLAVCFTLINLDDNGKTNSQLMKVGAFRNLPNIRYEGRIHEMLNVSEKALVSLEDTVAYHTGYSQSVFTEKQKSERNVKLLREELLTKPNDMNIKGYLADALTSRTDEESQNEVSELFAEVIESGKAYNKLRVKAYLYFIRKYMDDKESFSQAEEMCNRAMKEFPDTLDFVYYYGHLKSNMGSYAEAWDILRQCEQRLKNPSPRDESIFLLASPLRLYARLLMLASAIPDNESVFMYSTIILTMDKSKQDVLTACIKSMASQGITTAEMMPLLSDLYDLSNPAEKEFIEKAAMDAGVAIKL
ncbi:MAG: glycosyltransferase family 2 protein [Oscillospiraceae bacterium]|nr:glycosyltransferase family 2 protein [Oscillospiraceae bacterium]